MTSLDSEINGCDFENSDKPSLTDCVDGKDVDKKASPDVGEEQQDNSTNFYPGRVVKRYKSGSLLHKEN